MRTCENRVRKRPGEESAVPTPISLGADVRAAARLIRSSASQSAIHSLKPLTGLSLPCFILPHRSRKARVAALIYSLAHDSDRSLKIVNDARSK